MAYDPKLWIEIKERYWEGESPGEISKTFNGKPSRYAILKRAKAEDWDQQKSTKVNKKIQESNKKFADFLEEQEARYRDILEYFDETMRDTFPFCKPSEIISVHKDWRELRGIIEQRTKPVSTISREKLQKPNVLEALVKAAKEMDADDIS